MKTTAKFALLLLISGTTLLLAIGLGSVAIPPQNILAMLWEKLTGLAPATPLPASAYAIFWSIRLPRALLAFLVGAALAVSGVLMQSVLRNPLASAYTLGVSSGAAVGASLVILSGLTLFGGLTLPVFGFIFGMGTMLSAVALASRLDKNLSNSTIILTGMAFSMFANAIISFVVAWSRESSQRIIYWQMGSFSLKDWGQPALLLPVLLVGLTVSLCFCNEMDLMTFGEEQAQTAGVCIARVKWLLLAVGAVLSGVAVSLVGVIGFVDLFTPHVARKLFGSRHRLVLPASALLGGVFLVLCDLAARTLASPIELPVGAVTSALGAPFFLYLYFGKRR